MKNQPSPLGPVGREVARNIRAIRRQHRWTLQELSDKLAELDHPMGISALSKTERSVRRVDADDLVAFATVLGVTAPELLFGTERCPAVRNSQHQQSQGSP